jgi:hypothetical protein
MIVNGQIHDAAALLLWNQPPVLIRDWLEPKAGLATMKKKNVLAPADNQTWVLSCPAHCLITILNKLTLFSLHPNT